MTVIQSLNKLVHALDGKGISIHSYLRPGLSKLEVQAVLKPLGLTPPDELFALYEWHDGVDDGLHAPVQLFGEHQFLPLKDAVHEYEEMMHYYSLVPSSIAISKCFPFATFQADKCAVYCEDATLDGLLHPVISIYHDIYTLYENIEQMVETVTEWFASGVYDSEPVNAAQQIAIRQKFNPRISLS